MLFRDRRLPAASLQIVLHMSHCSRVFLCSRCSESTAASARARNNSGSRSAKMALGIALVPCKVVEQACRRLLPPPAMHVCVLQRSSVCEWWPLDPLLIGGTHNTCKQQTHRMQATQKNHPCCGDETLT
mmetsp:Transcript_115330/g.222336  ORF Transcript_115330/g.222336 Transcript_115330/m.222336 type:complete len:129 (+) Transcript_115330:335-721(+)